MIHLFIFCWNTDAMPVDPKTFDKPNKVDIAWAMTKALKSAKEGFHRKRKSLAREPEEGEPRNQSPRLVDDDQLPPAVDMPNDQGNRNDIVNDGNIVDDPNDFQSPVRSKIEVEAEDDSVSEVSYSDDSRNDNPQIVEYTDESSSDVSDAESGIW